MRELMETEAGLRPRGLEADGRAARPAGPDDPRGVRRLGLRLRRARRRARGDGSLAAVRAVLLDRGARRQHAAALSGDDAAKKAHLPGIAAGETIATLAFTEPNGQVGRSGHHRWRPPSPATATRSPAPRSFVLDGHTGEPHHRRRPHRRGRAACSPSTPTPTASPARRCRRWTRPASRPSSSSPARPADAARHRRRRLGRARPRCSTSSPSASPPSRSAAPRRCSTWPSSTPRCACSSAARSARSRPSSTSAPTCCSRSSRRSRPPTTAGWCAAELNDELPSVASLAKAYCSRGVLPRQPPRTSRSTAASASRGSTRRTLYFKRAKSCELLFGDPTYHRELLAQRIGI